MIGGLFLNNNFNSGVLNFPILPFNFLGYKFEPQTLPFNIWGNDNLNSSNILFNNWGNNNFEYLSFNMDNKNSILTNFGLHFNNFTPPVMPNILSTNHSQSTGNSSLISNASKYLGYNRNDGSYKLFTGGADQPWCADFVSYVIKETYGNRYSWLKSSSVSQLRDQAMRRGQYINLSDVRNKADYITRLLQEGKKLISIEKNGKSHTGIITKVENNQVYVIEGNASNSVRTNRYNSSWNTLSGVIVLS